MLKNRKLSPLPFITFTLLLMLLAACSTQSTQTSSESTTNPAATPEGEIVDVNENPVEEIASPTSAASINTVDSEENAEETSAAEDTAAITSTPYPIITREVPEDYDWKELPIQPEISQNAFDIYEYGLASGRDPEHISVIGDCQAIPFVFLGRYGLQQYTLSGSDTRLEPMIATFRDSFERKGAAVRGGFTAAAVLSPVRADPDLCMPGENPLECEWRIHNPSITFINLETWREEGTVDRYELYLEKIVEFALEHGTLPIIIMKADKAESETHVINPAMARVAYKYDVPIVNFWRAVQYIDNRGIDPDRDGFHLSEEGYELKEILALRTLYEVWSQYQTEEVQAQATPTTAPTATPLPEKPSLDFPAFTCEDNCLYYDFFAQSGSSIAPEGIFEFNLETNERQLIAENIALMDISTDQNQFLVTKEDSLFLIDRDRQTVELVIENIYSYGHLNAYFTDGDSTIVALAQGEENNQILLLNADNFTINQTLQSETNVINLLKYSDTSSVFYETGTCTALHFCTVDTIHELQTETKQDIEITEKEQIVFSPNGLGVAFRDPQYADEYNYYHNPILLYEETETGIASRRLFSFTHPGGFRVHPEITEYVFSPDSSKIFVLQDAYSDYFEKSVGLYLYLEDLDLRLVLDHGMLEGAYGSLSPIPVWSPDGTEILLLLTNTVNDRDFTLELFRKDILNRFSDFEQLMDPQPIDGYGYPGHAFWVMEENSSEE